jgi:hypothetical protein
MAWSWRICKFPNAPFNISRVKFSLGNGQRGKPYLPKKPSGPRASQKVFLLNGQESIQYATMARATQQTSSAAALAVGAELSRRGYDVYFTLGNTRKVDMLCCFPDGSPFKIQVKGISGEYGFRIEKSFFDGAAQENLFLVVVLVPKDEAAPFRFFVLSHDEAKKEFKKMPTHKKDGSVYEKGSGLNWGSVKPYEDSWGTFPTLNE